MTRIVVPKNDHIAAKKIEVNGPYSSEYYRKIVDEANERIREAHIREARAYLRAKNFIVL
ncbi:hypothetical protein IJH02_01410 [Candidatus Saccharibacteria bacterium]|nr:hypothetical protein [Candidatus Saccharibacteria bacterium]